MMPHGTMLYDNMRYAVAVAYYHILLHQAGIRSCSMCAHRQGSTARRGRLMQRVDCPQGSTA